LKFFADPTHSTHQNHPKKNDQWPAPSGVGHFLVWTAKILKKMRHPWTRRSGLWFYW
jgi:hypothetical protein